MMEYKNRFVTNRRSPKNEDMLVRAYKEMNPKANRKDKLDIAAVKTTTGEKGHALLNQSVNRSKDDRVHRGIDYISDKELNKALKNKK